MLACSVVAATRLDDAAESESVQSDGAEDGDQELPAGHHARRGRIWEGLQRLGGRGHLRAVQVRRRNSSRRQKVKPRQLSGPTRMEG